MHFVLFMCFLLHNLHCLTYFNQVWYSNWYEVQACVQFQFLQIKFHYSFSLLSFLVDFFGKQFHITMGKVFKIVVQFPWDILYVALASCYCIFIFALIFASSCHISPIEFQVFATFVHGVPLCCDFALNSTWV